MVILICPQLEGSEGDEQYEREARKAEKKYQRTRAQVPSLKFLPSATAVVFLLGSAGPWPGRAATGAARGEAQQRGAPQPQPLPPRPPPHDASLGLMKTMVPGKTTRDESARPPSPL